MRPTKQRMLWVLTVLISGVLLAPRHVAAQYDPTAVEPVGKIRGSLVIHGGGAVQDSVQARFVELAGGREAQVVFIPTASSSLDTTDDYESWLAPWREQNPGSLTVLHTRSRDRANDEEFVAPLRLATGVWFSGGDQSRLEEAYIGTAVESAIEGVLQRGGVVGGSSAGAAFLSRVMIDRAEVHRGLNLLPGAVIDQHFIVRNRQDRLMRVLAKHSALVGFGVDERSAMVVRGRSIEVMGDSDVLICMAASSTRPERIERLEPGKRADLIALSRAAVARCQPCFPASEPHTPELSNGSLIIVGGGGMPTGLLERFIKLAGSADARIIYVPCEPDDVIPREPSFCNELRKAGAKNVTWLHTKDRSQANLDEEFLKPFGEARGIWFGGGRQWNLVDSYQNTTAHRLMHEVLARGGVIGGSSAGASIQGDYMPRGDPLGNLNIIAEGYERGLGFLTGVAIDQHFTQRKRHADMTSLIRTYPQLLGIGIDEGTALVVQTHIAEIVGQGEVAFYDAHRQSEDSERDYIAVRSGGRFDLKSRQMLEP
jgi:cyanophycinase